MKNKIRKLLLPVGVLFVALSLAGCMKDKSDYDNLKTESRVRVLNLWDGQKFAAVGTTPLASGREITALGVHMNLLTQIKVNDVSTPITSADFKTLTFDIPTIIVSTPTEVDVKFFQGQELVSTLKATIAASL